MGGDIKGTVVLSTGWTLCDLEPGGGGPGGGGGTPAGHSHLVCEPDLERAEVGVSTAPADIALRAAGGWDMSRVRLGRIDPGLWKIVGPMLCLAVATRGLGSGVLGCGSVSLLLLSDGRPNRRSRDGPRPPDPGGGGNETLAAGSGDEW